MSTIKNLKPRSQVRVKVNFRQNKILFDTCIEIFLKLYRCQNTSPVPLFMTLLERCTGPTPVQQHLVHHLIPCYFTVSRPGATDPRAKQQALAPSLPMRLNRKLMFVTVWLTFNASARACGQKTMANHVKPEKSWELTRRSATLK